MVVAVAILVVVGGYMAVAVVAVVASLIVTVDTHQRQREWWVVSVWAVPW